MEKNIRIGSRTISKDGPVYVIAEMSGNHNMDFERAKAIIDAAAYAGADAVKLQTYTADTITMDCRDECFISTSKLWKGMSLYELYQQAYTPWEWQGELISYANSKGLDCFSSPFDLTAVDFLENLNVPAYKIASFEINDIPLIRKVARTGKPIIMSIGIAHPEDIELALETCRQEGNEQVILLKCISAYPAPLENMNLKVIEDIAARYDCISGLSDHSMENEVAIASVALSAKVVEKHLTLKRSDGGPDAAFSMEPDELKRLVEQIRNVEKALGTVTYELNEAQEASRAYSRSLFVTENVAEGELFTPQNVRSIRPGNGLHTKYYEQVIGQRANRDLRRGTPMSLDYLAKEHKDE